MDIIILGRNTSDVTGIIKPNSKITSYEGWTSKNYSFVGKIESINIKEHTESFTELGSLVGTLRTGLIIIIFAWAYWCCCCKGLVLQDEEYYLNQIEKIENQMKWFYLFIFNFFYIYDYNHRKIRYWILFQWCKAVEDELEFGRGGIEGKEGIRFKFLINSEDHHERRPLPEHLIFIIYCKLIWTKIIFKNKIKNWWW